MEKLSILLFLLLLPSHLVLTQTTSVTVDYELDLYEPSTPENTFTVENTYSLCLFTKIYSTDLSDYNDQMSKTTEAIGKISKNALFEEKKATSETVKRLLADLEILSDHVALFKNDIKNLEKFTDADNTTTLGQVCDITYVLSFDPLLPMLTKLAKGLESTYGSIKDDAKANADRDTQNSVYGIVDVDTSILQNSVMDTRHFIDTMYDVHENLFQNELPTPVLRYLNKEVEELNEAKRENFKVINCEKVIDGLICDLTVKQLERDEIAFRILSVPFEYNNDIFALELQGNLLDSSGTLLAYCDHDPDGKCRNVRWKTDACINALTEGELAQIGTECYFKKVQQDGDPTVVSTKEGLIFGATLNHAIIILDNQQKVVSLPSKICYSGDIVYNSGERSQVMKGKCLDNAISYLKYNQTSISIIFSHASYWHKLSDLIPDTHEEVMAVFNTIISFLTILLGIGIACNCINNCSRRRRRRRRRTKGSRDAKIKAKEDTTVQCHYEEVEMDDLGRRNRSRAEAVEQQLD